MEVIILLVSIIFSLLFISKGSDWLTDSLEPIAAKLNTSSISVGLILVSLVVSLPEILVALTAAILGYKDITLGVAFGSIICNIGLMIGLPALAKPLKVTLNMILRDGIFSVVVPILVFAVSQGGQISRLEGLSLFLLFIPYLTNVFLQEKSVGKKEFQETKKDITVELRMIDFGIGKMKAGWLSFIIGVVILLTGSYLFTNQLVEIVKVFRIDALFVGLTIGAIVPSVPNIVAAYKATEKGMTEVAVSETLGSNIFTLLVTVGLIAMISPVIVSPHWLVFDIPVMILFSFLLLFFMSTEMSINKREGAILLGFYLFILFIQTLLFMH